MALGLRTQAKRHTHSALPTLVGGDPPKQKSTHLRCDIGEIFAFLQWILVCCWSNTTNWQLDITERYDE